MGLRGDAPRAPDGSRRQNSRFNIAGLRPANARRLRQPGLTTEAMPFGHQTSADGQMREIPGARGLAPPTTCKHTPLPDGSSKPFLNRQTLCPGEPKHLPAANG